MRSSEGIGPVLNDVDTIKLIAPLKGRASGPSIDSAQRMRDRFRFVVGKPVDNSGKSPLVFRKV